MERTPGLARSLLAALAPLLEATAVSVVSCRDFVVDSDGEGTSWTVSEPEGEVAWLMGELAGNHAERARNSASGEVGPRLPFCFAGEMTNFCSSQ